MALLKKKGNRPYPTRSQGDKVYERYYLYPYLDKLKERIKKLKNSDTSGTLMKSDPAVDLPLMGREGIRRYLEGVDMSEFITDKNDKRLYHFIRQELIESLSPRNSADLIFSALIERIARTAVILQRLDKLTCASSIPFTLMQQKGLKSDYLGIQVEHRRCVEAFVNLRYAFETKPKGKVLERLRETIKFED